MSKSRWKRRVFLIMVGLFLLSQVSSAQLVEKKIDDNQHKIKHPRVRKKLPAYLILAWRVKEEGNPDVPAAQVGWAVPDLKYQAHLRKLGFEQGIAIYTPELTMDYLKQFNVVVVLTLPLLEKSSSSYRMVEKKKKLLLDYVKEGGGLLVLRSPGWQFGKDIEEMNEWLKPCGVEILSEQVVDNEYLVRTEYGYKLSWTNNLIKHPITEGVSGIFYPAIYNRYTDFTSPLRVSKDWQVLLYGKKTARSLRTIKSGVKTSPSPGTFASAPPLLAVREYGKGRIAIWPIAATCVWQDAYHILWGRGLTMEGEKAGMKGNAARLLDNLFTYLAEPSEGIFGGYVPQQIESTPEVGFIKINWDKRQVKGVLMPNCYCGLIGVKTSLSSGKGKPEQFIQVAKQAGYDFIAFTEDISKLTPEKFKQLKETCEKYSNNSFKAYPGFLYKDESGNLWVTFSDSLTWPAKDWWSKKYPGRLTVNNVLSRGWHWPPVILIKSHSNPEKPWYQGNFKGFSIYTYENGKLVDDSLDYYLRLQKESFNLFPVAVHLINTPEGVIKAKSNGFQTYVRWFDHNVIEALSGNIGKYKGNYVWYRSSFVSESPIIEDSRILNFGTSDLAIQGNDRFRMHIKVSSRIGLKEVTILDSDNGIWRRFLPRGKKEFEKTIDYFHNREYKFIVTVTDINNKKAIGWGNWTQVQENSYPRCSGNFNTMPRGKWWGPPKDMQNTRGMENYLISRNFPYHLPIWGGVKESARPAVEYYPYLVSRFGSIIDCILENHYPVSATSNPDRTDIPEIAVPNEYLTGKVRHIFFTPWQDSSLIQLIEGNFTVKKDFTLKNAWLTRYHGRQGADVVCATKKDGTFFSGKLTRKNCAFRGSLPLNGFVALFPQPFRGSLGIISFQNGLDYLVFLSRSGKYGNFRLQLSSRNKNLKAGDKITYRYLGVVSKLDPPTDNSFITDICNSLGIGKEPAYQVNPISGSVISTYYILKLKAKRYGFSGKITEAKLPLNLPVEIEGLNPRWDAGIWYKGKNTLVIPEWVVDKVGNRYTVRKKRTGENQLIHIPVMNDGVGMLQIDTEIGNKDIYIGNFLVSDNPMVWLTLVDIRPKKAAFVAHNPTDKKIICQVKPGPGFSLLGEFSQQVIIPAGSSVTVIIDKK
ncbi:hypothetical protein J7K25_03235 [bacterium]|nr:hypothetical protein [bacterium]